MVLRSFRLANHSSFRDEHELLLMPALPGDDRAVVPAAAIYGANASGKSNLLDGLWQMRGAVVGPLVLGAGDRDFFLLDDAGATRPSVYVVEIIAEGIRYTYGFSVDDEQVLEEWLYAYPEKRKRVIFERQDGEVRFGSTVADLKGKFAALEELIRRDTLFLGVCDRLELGPLMPVYRWFEHGLRIRTRTASRSVREVGDRVGAFIRRSPDNARKLSSLLAAADVGITDVLVEQVEGPLPVRRWSRPPSPQGGAPRQTHWVLKLRHGPGAEPFDLYAESAGTLNWLELLPTVLEVLDRGQAFVVDEIDTSLHPMLTAKLVGLFQTPETNPNAAQLIFTTHDTSLLGTMLGDQVLDRDQIWFVEKGAEGASQLYPLTDFKPRKEQNTERRYLAGSYGAVPVLADSSFADAVLGK
ncbi:ATP/GTP-binding protein [Amycolatopsis sp. NPDC059027]|uniref:AAA family ATPase n=1 Tax=Amycolatopsis sp. NPDC059027 TaxID=3346709 RepID=UPI0036734C73